MTGERYYRQTESRAIRFDLCIWGSNNIPSRLSDLEQTSEGRAGFAYVERINLDASSKRGGIPEKRQHCRLRFNRKTNGPTRI